MITVENVRVKYLTDIDSFVISRDGKLDTILTKDEANELIKKLTEFLKPQNTPTKSGFELDMDQLVKKLGDIQKLAYNEKVDFPGYYQYYATDTDGPFQNIEIRYANR